jgi:hypothetical protein
MRDLAARGHAQAHGVRRRQTPPHLLPHTYILVRACGGTRGSPPTDISAPASPHIYTSHKDTYVCVWGGRRGSRERASSTSGRESLLHIREREPAPNLGKRRSFAGETLLHIHSDRHSSTSLAQTHSSKPQPAAYLPLSLRPHTLVA